MRRTLRLVISRRNSVAMSEPLVTFCMPLKDRAERARSSVDSLLRATRGQRVSLSICEDIGITKLDLEGIDPHCPVRHWWVSTGQIWNRSLLLNYSFKRASTPFLATWDADFLFPEDFGERIIREIQTTKWQKAYLRIGVTETERSEMLRGNIAKGTIWGGLYVYHTAKVVALRGYDERFKNHGHEERDFNDRYRLAYNVCEKYVQEPGYVWHASHSNDMRADYNGYNRRLREMNARNGQTRINREWGKAQTVREWREK